MGHYDSSREGYCAGCGAAPGNMVNGECPFCAAKRHVKNMKEGSMVNVPHEPKHGDPEIHALYTRLIGRRDQISLDLTEINNGIKALQTLCKHERTSYVPGHHSSHECLDCGKQDV